MARVCLATRRRHQMLCLCVGCEACLTQFRMASVQFSVTYNQYPQPGDIWVSELAHAGMLVL